MKFAELRSIGHNIADSLSGGIGLMIGNYMMDIHGEAADSPEGFITVDFLIGETSGGRPSASLSKSISLYSTALRDLCRKHGGTADAFSELKVRFSRDFYGRRRFVVSVRDNYGRRACDEYIDGKRVKVLDELGRIRPKHNLCLPGAD